MATCGKSKEWRGRNACGRATGREQSWNPACAIAQADQFESSAKAVPSAAHLVEKMGWMPTIVRPSDWNLVVAIELQRLKEDRAAAKEWAQIDNLIKLCEAARSSSNGEAVALACLSVGHCVRRSEAGGLVGQAGEGIQFFGAKS